MIFVQASGVAALEP